MSGAKAILHSVSQWSCKVACKRPCGEPRCHKTEISERDAETATIPAHTICCSGMPPRQAVVRCDAPRFLYRTGVSERAREREWRSRLREAVLAWFMPSSPLSHSTVHPVVKKHSLHSEKCGRAFVWSFQTTPFPMIRNRTATPARDGGSR